jgi:hypothetical protein
VTATPHVGGTCGSVPCWRTSGSPPTKWKYRDRSLAADGVKSIDLKSGSSARAKVGFKAKGALLPLPGFTTLPTPLTVQLMSSDGTCFGATFQASGVSKNAAGTFKARSE